MPGGQIPDYEKAVQMRSMPMAVQNFNIDPASVAGMYIQAGRFITKGLDDIKTWADKEQERTDKLAVDSQYAAFAQEADQYMQENVVSQKGTYAPAPETVRANLDLIRQKYAAKLDSRKAQDEFFSAAGSRMTSSVTMATAHREKEYSQSLVETNAAIAKDSANNAENLAPLVGTEHPQFIENMDKGFKAIQIAGEAQGTAPEMIKLQQGQFKSGVFANIVQNKIAAGDITGAQVLFDKENAKNTFDPGTRNTIMATLKNHNDLQTAAEDLKVEGAKLPQVMDVATKYGAVNDLINKSSLSEERKRNAIKLNTARLEDYQRADNAQRIAKNERYMKDLGTLTSKQDMLIYAASIPDAAQRAKFMEVAQAVLAPANVEKDMADAQVIRQAIDRGSITVEGIDGKPITIPVQNDSDIVRAARMSKMNDNVVREGVAYWKDRGVKDADLKRIWTENLPGDVDHTTYKLPPPDFYPFVRNRLPAGQTATPEFLASATRDYIYEKGWQKQPMHFWKFLGQNEAVPMSRYEYMKDAKKGFENFSPDLLSRAQADMMIAYEKATGKKPAAPPNERMLNLFIQDKIRKGEYNAR